MKERMVPKRGDIVSITLGPVSGHEQDGRRPVLVLSPEIYNSKTNLAVVCPITSKVKGFPFEVAIATKNIHGVVLADQVRTIDWSARNAVFVARARESVVAEVQGKLTALIL